MLFGKDISDDITAHQLAALLLEGPDFAVRVPDDTAADEANCVSIGRITHDHSSVYLCGYFLGRDGDEVSGDYHHESEIVTD